MVICGTCENVANEHSDVMCQRSCGFVSHACVKGDYEKKTRSSKDFSCKDCRTGSSQGIYKSVDETSNSLTNWFLSTIIDGLKKEVFVEMNVFKKEVSNEIASFKGEIAEFKSTVLEIASNHMDNSSK